MPFKRVRVRILFFFYVFMGLFFSGSRMLLSASSRIEFLQPETAALRFFPILRRGVSTSKMLPRKSMWRGVSTVEAPWKAKVRAAATRGRLALVEDAS